MEPSLRSEKAYLVAVAATLVGGLDIMALMAQVQDMIALRIVHNVLTATFLLTAVSVFATATLFLGLSQRPRPWGKFLCLLGIPPVLFAIGICRTSVFGRSILTSGLLIVPGLMGALLLLCGAAIVLTGDHTKNAV